MATTTTASETQKRFYSAPIKKKNYTQTVSIILGCLMIVIALSGILNEEFAGLHLSAMHSLVLFGGGVLCLWAASKRKSKKAFYVDLGLGIFFAINAIAGFALGTLGEPTVGYGGRDAMLVKWAPGFIELGIVDHIVHSFLAVFFLTGALYWKRHHNFSGDRTH